MHSACTLTRMKRSSAPQVFALSAGIVNTSHRTLATGLLHLLGRLQLVS